MQNDTSQQNSPQPDDARHGAAPAAAPPIVPRGSYGVDAPGIPWMWVGCAALSAAAAGALAVWHPAWWVAIIAWYLAASALFYLAGAAVFWHTTRRGKFLVWDRMLAHVDRDDIRTALDIGCGRGAVAILTALRHPHAQVTGIDLWRTKDQSGNDRQATAANARANGVDGRVRIDTGDMTELPYADASFDLVTASLAVHNLPRPEQRRLALDEAFRVLAPGGRMLIVDLQHTDDFADHLRQLGLIVVGPTRLGWNGWWTGPWMASRAIRAAKLPGPVTP